MKKVETIKKVYKHYKYYITFTKYTDFACYRYCVYIEIPILHPYYKKHHMELNLNVHGGLICADWCDKFDKHTHWYIGWDYNHYGDYNGSALCNDTNYFVWNPELIEAECIDAIDQLISVDKSLIKVY